MAKEADGRQRGTDDTFTGRAAQLAVMAELLRLRCNVAIPEVDLGTDVFAFRDEHGDVARLQVKACTVPYPYADGSGFSAKFVLPLRQLRNRDEYLPLHYVLAVLRDGRWSDFLVISRARLQSLLDSPDRFGSLNSANDAIELTVEFRTAVTCSGRVLTDCRNAWASLPPLHPATPPSR